MNYDQSDLITAFYDKLKDNIGSQVSNRIYELEAPQNEALPHITFNLLNDNTDNSDMTMSNIDCEFEVNLWGWKKLGFQVLRVINDSLFNSIKKTSIIIDNYDNGLCWCSDRGTAEVNDDILLIRSTYRVFAGYIPNPSV